MEELKGFLGGIISRWLLKAIGGYFMVNGASGMVVDPTVENATLQLAAGLATFIVGAIISLVQHKLAINTPVPGQK